MSKCFHFTRVLLLAVLAVMPGSRSAQADPLTFHIMDINEIYSSVDGTKQFVELIARSAGQTNLAPTWVIALSADGTDTNIVFDFTASFPALGNGETVLLATQPLADELGFQSDFVIPENSLFLSNGRVIFEDPPPTPTFVDAIAYGNYTGSNTNYGLPAPALPNDGCHSLQRIVPKAGIVPDSNNVNWAVSSGGATPRRNDGTTATLSCPPVPPVLAAIGSKSVNEIQLLSFGITATDGNADPIVLSLENAPLGAGFTDNGNGTGSFSWTPDCLQSGMHEVQFRATAGGDVDSEFVTITVNEVSDPAVARDTVATVDEDSQTAQNLQGYDPDGNPVMYTITGGPFFGQALNLNTATGAFTYQPNPNQFSGPPDVVFFTISDNNCVADTGRWDVTINPINDAPVATDLNAGTTPNAMVSVGPMPASDVDNGSLVFSHLSGPFHGSVANLNTANGSFDYTPAPDYEGEDTIFYAASDGSLADTARVLITIALSCNCSCHADPTCDGSPTVLDVVATVNIAFRNGADTVDPACTHVGRADNNCDCVVSVLDVVNMVNHAFRNDLTPFCDACASPCP